MKHMENRKLSKSLKKLKILVADTNTSIKDLLLDLTLDNRYLEIVAVASTETEAIELFEETEPDCIMIDKSVPNKMGKKFADMIYLHKDLLILDLTNFLHLLMMKDVNENQKRKLFELIDGDKTGT